MKHNETSEEDQKMKEYQTYVEIIQRSFNILKERESMLIESLHSCKGKKADHLHFHYGSEVSNHSSTEKHNYAEDIPTDSTNYHSSTETQNDAEDSSDSTNYHEDTPDDHGYGAGPKVFPSSDRAMQQKRKKPNINKPDTIEHLYPTKTEGGRNIEFESN